MIDHFLTTMIARWTVDKTMEQYEKDQRENASILKPPALIFILGLVDLVFFSGVLLACVIFVKDSRALLICSAILGCFVLLGLFLMAYQKNFLLVYQSGTMIYRNLFRVTRTFNCREIACACYTDGGGIKIVFRNGKKLHFAKEESGFAKNMLKCEHIKCRFMDADNPITKVSLNPVLMFVLWGVSGAMALTGLAFPEMLLLGIFMLLICVLCQTSYTVYDKQSRILTRRKWGFAKTYDMHFHCAKPFYENGHLMKIEIYSGKKKVASVPASIEYKNRAKLLWVLCSISV